MILQSPGHGLHIGFWASEAKDWTADQQGPSLLDCASSGFVGHDDESRRMVIDKPRAVIECEVSVKSAGIV